MPTKGMYTQALTVLFEGLPEIDQVAARLKDFTILKQTEGEGQFSGPGLLLDYLQEQNGFALVDVVDGTWPDDMGDPQESAEVFAAWTFGAFGPATFPGNMERAIQQSWTWRESEQRVPQHKSFVRVRSSYVFGSGDDQPVLPENYAAVPELLFLSKVVHELLKLPGAICYFNPGGELLLPADQLQASLASGEQHGYVPVDAWVNVRMFNLDEQWSMMDTVGNAQVDLPDIEACFQASRYDPSEVANFIRNNTLYMLNPSNPEFKDGDTIDGPGGKNWHAFHSAESVVSPPRRTLRFFPDDGTTQPEAFEVKPPEDS